MTTIAWDGKTLAADKRAVSGSIIAISNKIIRHEDFLIGRSGAFSETAALLEWFKNGADVTKFPNRERELKNSCLLVIDINGCIYKYLSSSPYPLTLPPQKIAIGSGSEIAITAMHLGKTAKEAVLIASELDTHTGNGVDILEF